MNVAEKPKLKICGMREAANVAAIADLQPDYMGFIFYPPSPRFVGEISAELIKYVPDGIKTVGVFVNQPLAEIQNKVVKHQLKAVQLHGEESVADCEMLKQQGLEVIKSFGISANFDFTQLTDYQHVVDYFLFDTQTQSYGGSGKIFDWTLLSKYQLEKPYFLSGGIGLAQLTQIFSINDSRFYALDVNSKLETEPGLKEVKKVAELMAHINHYYAVKP